MTGVDYDWLGPIAERGPVPGLDRPLEVAWSVIKPPGGPVAATVRFEPVGPSAESGNDADVVELSASPADSVRLVIGEVTPNVAWMSGRLKASGPTGPLLALLAHAETPGG